MISKAQVSALCAGDGWLDKGANLLLFGPPGVALHVNLDKMPELRRETFTA
jgi:hypothetical protein